MTGQGRPGVTEERWLNVAAELGAAVPRDALAGRTGGWRSAGLLARCALFVLGLVATALFFGILGFNDITPVLVAGLAATGTAEWLTRGQRLHASGIEEGLCVAGFLAIGIWITSLPDGTPALAGGSIGALVLIAAVGAAGLRLLNPLVTTAAAIGLVYWIDSTTAARALDQALGGGLSAFLIGCSLALLALLLGARVYRRPSHDRMLDWLVVALPVAAYVQQSDWYMYELSQASPRDHTLHLVILSVLLALAVAMLVTGLRRRRHAPLLGFLGCLACIAVELRSLVVATTENWLIACGLAALVAGVALDRYLRTPRDGVTSAALSARDGPLDLLQTAGAAILAQRTTDAQPPPPPAVTPGDGRFGGGGASGSF